MDATTPRASARIAIYADRESLASPTPLAQEIARVFNAPSLSIEHVDRHDIMRPTLYENLALFVLPGIVGEQSLYHAHVGPANDLIRSYVAQGGSFAGFCAGACFAAASVAFTPSWAAHRQRNEGLLALFNGHAQGPVPAFGVDGNNPAYFHGLTHARLHARVGKSLEAMLCAYSSGPMLMPHTEQAASVLARYADGEAEAPAIIAASFGSGLALLSGPVPQYGAMAPVKNEKFASLNALMNRLQPYEETRKALFDSLMRMAKNKARARGLQVV